MWAANRLCLCIPMPLLCGCLVSFSFPCSSGLLEIINELEGIWGNEICGSLEVSDKRCSLFSWYKNCFLFFLWMAQGCSFWVHHHTAAPLSISLHTFGHLAILKGVPMTVTTVPIISHYSCPNPCSPSCVCSKDTMTYVREKRASSTKVLGKRGRYRNRIRPGLVCQYRQKSTPNDWRESLKLGY